MNRSVKQEREYQKRRQQKRDERLHARAARRRVVAIVVGIVVVVAAMVLILVLNRPQGEDDSALDVAPLPSSAPLEYDSPPDPAAAEGRTWDVTLHTTEGDIGLELDGAKAPQATANFLRLAEDGYYDDTGCHRLLPNALLQCGDPTATGTGGPGYGFGPIENAPEDDVYQVGTLAMARQGNDAESMGSQFFLVFDSVPLPADSAGGYTVFGHITEGLDILRQVGSAGTVPGSEQPTLPVTIEGVTIS